jgi:hypothetical protein
MEEIAYPFLIFLSQLAVGEPRAEPELHRLVTNANPKMTRTVRIIAAFTSGVIVLSSHEICQWSLPTPGSSGCRLI